MVFKENHNKEKGWIQLWRKIRESEIWEQEPWRLKTWLWMILEANHDEIERFGRKLKRGQLYVNRIEDLCKVVRWNKWFVYKMPTVEAMKQFWKWLRKKGMVDTKKTTRGTIITILNYGEYQDIKKPYVDTIADTNIDTTQTPMTPQDRQPLKQLNKHDSAKASLPIREIISFFRSQVREKRGFEPEISWAKDGNLVKQRLKKYTSEQLKDLVAWYLESKHSERLGVSLATCLSAFIINLWLEDTT